MENKVDNINKPSHYQIDCGIESIEAIDIIEAALRTERFVGFCLGNVYKYLIRAEKKNGIEDYKKARKYLEWVIEIDTIYECRIIENDDPNVLFKDLGVEWSQIISGIAKDLNIKNAFELDSIFRNLFNENYEIARDMLDNFIKEYEKQDIRV